MFPIFKEHSKIPALLSKVSPIEIGAISLGLFVFARAKLSETTKLHETIHYKQWLELGFVGFLILYPLFWLVLRIKYRSGKKAYVRNPFEREAYRNEADEDYLINRRPYAWVKYIGV